MTRRILIVNAALATVLTMGVACAQQVLINGAGATFPYPMYSKWFDEYHKKDATYRSTTSPSVPAAASSRSPQAPSISAPPTAP